MAQETNFLFDFSKIRIHEWDEAYYFDFEASIGMQAFRTLLKNQESTLSVLQNELREAVAADTKDMSEEESAAYESQIFHHQEMTVLELKKQQRYGLCVALFSFSEGLLKKICSRIEDTFSFRIKIDDLNNNEDLMLYWNYLIKVFEIDRASVEPLFTPIKQQKIVRNIIAHQGGRLRQDQTKKIQIVSGLKLSQFGDEYEIEIEDTVYLMYLIDLMSSFFNKLSWAIDNAYKSRLSIKSAGAEGK